MRALPQMLKTNKRASKKINYAALEGLGLDLPDNLRGIDHVGDEDDDDDDDNDDDGDAGAVGDGAAAEGGNGAAAGQTGPVYADYDEDGGYDDE